MKYAKHIHVLQLLSTIPTGVKPTRAHTFSNWVWPAGWEQQCNDAWDHIFAYIHANWAAPDTAIAPGTAIRDYPRIDTDEGKIAVFDCNAMLMMPHEEFVAKLELLPPYFSEVVFPIAVGRYMLRDLALAINHRTLTTFTEFHNRYGAIILSY